MSTTRTPFVRAAAAGAAALTLVLAACGSGGTASGKPATIKVARAGGDAPGASAALAAGGAGAKASPTAEDGTARSAASDEPATTMLAPYLAVEYAAGPGLPALGGSAKAWRYPAGGVTKAAVVKLAKALRVSGDPVEIPADTGGGWRVGPDDGSAPSLHVGPDAAGTWWYDGASPATRAKIACSEPGAPPDGAAADTAVAPRTLVPAPVQPTPDVKPAVEPGVKPAVEPTTGSEGSTAGSEGSTAGSDGSTGTDGSTTPACPQPEPPTGVPTDAEALTLAKALAAAVSAPPAGGRIEVGGDEWGRYASWSVEFDGMPLPWMWSATFGGDGALVYAGGQLAAPQAAAPYPRIGTAAAIAALNAAESIAPPLAATGRAEGAVAADTGASGAPLTTTSGPATPTSATPTTGTVLTSPATTGPAVTPPRVTSTIASVPGSPSTITSVPGSPSTIVIVTSPSTTTGSAAIPTTTQLADPTATPDPPVEKRRVTITAAEPALYAVWAVDGEVWLVPGYRFITSEGDIVVPAIAPEYLDSSAGDAATSGVGVGGTPAAGSGAAPAVSPAVAPAVTTTAG